MPDWIDLAPYGMKLMVVDLPPQAGESAARRVLVMANGEAQRERVEALGFVREPRAGAWVHVGAPKPSLERIAREFPDARRIEGADMRQFHLALGGARPAADPDSGAPRPDPAPPPTPRDAVRPGAERAPAPEAGAGGPGAIGRFLGLNRAGQSVHDSPAGRVAVDERGRVHAREADGGGAAPGGAGAVFLRGRDGAQLAAAAEGFAREMDEGRVLRFADLKRFAGAAFDVDPGDLADGDPRLERAHAAVEGAVARAVARRGRGFAEAYAEAVKLSDAHPYVADLARHRPALAHLPQPVAVAVRRVLGTEADLAGKRVVVAGAGSGALLAHLPRGVDLRAHESDPDAAAQARATLQAALGEQGALSEDAPDFGGASFAVVDLRRLDAEAGGLEGAIEGLAARDPTGRSVFLLRAGQSPGEAAALARAQARLASLYAVEGTVDLDGGLHAGRPDAEPLRLVVVGRRRPQALEAPPEAATRVRRAHDFQDLRAWTAEVIAARAKIAERHAPPGGAGAAPGDEAARAALDERQARFQAPYAALSGVGQASTMLPRNLEGATREALARVARQHGDVDRWVAEELAMTREQLAEAFSPEQIDALGLAMHAEGRGRAFLNGDMTGTGKGRWCAALMRRAALGGGATPKGKIVYLTEKEINLSDIWRDVGHIDSRDEFAPWILNDGAKVIDEATGEVVLESPNALETKALAALRHWPDGTPVTAHTLTPEAAERRGGNRHVFLLGDAPLPEGVAQADIARTHTFAPSANLVLATYSQFNRPGEAGRGARGAETPVSDKSAWLRAVVDADTLLVLDECHNAASGNSNASRNVASAKSSAGHVLYSSATYAKAADMGIYDRLFPEDFDAEDLSEIVRRGGEPLQETLSAMLVKDGVMVRREHDLSKCDFRVVVDEANAERNRAYMDRLAPVLAEMAYLSGDLDRRVLQANVDHERRLRQRHGENENAVRRGLKSLQVTRMGFGSPLYNLSRLFLCSLLVDKAAEEALAALREGKKPVVVVENTIQSVLQELAQDQQEGAAAPDFKDLMRRALGQITRVTQGGRRGREVVDLAAPDAAEEAAEDLVERVLRDLPERGLEGGGDPKPALRAALDRAGRAALREAPRAGREAFAPALEAALERVRALVEALPDDPGAAAPAIRGMAEAVVDPTRRAVRRIAAMIEDLPDLPASAIDVVRDRIEAAGYSCEEITGRTWECRGGRVARRAGANKVEVKNRFNAGATDAVIINTAGATGIDLHAGARFADQRPRVLVELQNLADVRKQIQVYGRVNRFDQVVGPQILRLVAGLPMEMRLLSMGNAKLRCMSANTTSNRDHSALVESIPDLINPVGDLVCSRFAEARPDLMRRLGFEVDRNAEVERANRQAAEEGQGDDSKRSANEFLARLAMLPVALQEQVMGEIEAEYAATLEELDAKGENPLRSKSIEGVVHPRERRVFDGADVEAAVSEFHRAVYAQAVVIEHKTEPLRGQDIAAQYERGLAQAGADRPDAYAGRLERGRGRILQPFVPRDAADLQDALAREPVNPMLARMNARLDALIGFLNTARPGCEISVSVDGVAERGVVTRMHMAKRGYEHLASHYEVEFFLPGDALPRRYKVGSLLSDENFALSEGLNGEDYDAVLAQFDRALEGARYERRTILTGNDWRAVALSAQHKLGSMVTWTDAERVRHRGVLVSKRHADLDFLPVGMANARMAAAAVREDGAELFGAADMKDSGLVVKSTREGTHIVHLPDPASRKHGGLYEHPPVAAMLQRFREREAAAAAALAAEGRPARPPARRPKLEVGEAMLEPLLGHLMDAGARLHAPSRHRPWANRWMAENYAARPEDAAPGAEARAPAARAPR